MLFARSNLLSYVSLRAFVAKQSPANEEIASGFALATTWNILGFRYFLNILYNCTLNDINLIHGWQDENCEQARQCR